jgi:hypothetical protein
MQPSAVAKKPAAAAKKRPAAAKKKPAARRARAAESGVISNKLLKALCNKGDVRPHRCL